jgi:hypothetical protein
MATRRKRDHEAPLTPLAYLLSVVADESVPMRDRLRAAQIVLPYLHLPLAPLDLDDEADYPAIQ